MSALDLIKRHPYIAGGAVAVVVGFVLLSGGSSDSGASPIPGMSDADYQAYVNAGANLQASQYAYQAQSAQLGAALSSQQDQDATQITLANIAAGMQQNNNQVAGQVALAQIAQTGESTDLANTLQAQLGQAQLNTQQQIAALGASIEQAQITATENMHASDNATLVSVTGIQAKQATDLAGIYTQGATNLAAINSQTALGVANINAQPHSLFGAIFG